MKGDLVKHIAKTHGDTIYKCEQCSTGFRFKNDLRDHYKVHYSNFDEQQIEEEIHDVEVVTEDTKSLCSTDPSNKEQVIEVLTRDEEQAAFEEENYQYF